jgi:hypothetical protein
MIFISFLSLTFALFRIVVRGPWLALVIGSMTLLVFGSLADFFFIHLLFDVSPPPLMIP